MNLPFPENISLESLFVWLMHRISEVFGEHAILKGGMALRLINSPRSTRDLDYVFVPYTSKKEIIGGLEKIVGEIPKATINKTMNSKAINITIRLRDISVQIEASVSKECKAIAMSTGALARQVNQLGKIIKIMSFDVALSHKLAAWNERRLLRDLYDVYYIYEIIGERPNLETLLSRLANVESRIPDLKKIKNMSLKEFVQTLCKEAGKIEPEKLERELRFLLDKNELAGLDIKIKAALNKLAEDLHATF